jgi:GNAT superfamily N-acetyltransferase
MTHQEQVVTIRLATAADTEQITGTLVEAFLDTPDGPWLIPDRDERRQVYQRFCTALVGYTFQHGYIEVTDDLDAAAVWFDYAYSMPDLAEYDRLRTTACGPFAARFRLLDDTFAHHHPQQPHHYLAWLGVHPDRQRTGLGSALLAHRNQQLDAAGLPAYLVATSSGARDLYARHGYALPQAPFFLPDSGPPMWSMWRQPPR